MDKLNVALIAPTYLTVPCPGYGGIEPILWDLAKAVGDLGHDVTLIAAHGSQKPPKGNLYEVTGGNQNFGDEEIAFKQYQDVLGAFDIVSDHTHSHFSYLQRMICSDITIQTTRHSQWGNMSPPKSPNPNVPLPEPKPYNFCGISNYHSRECSGLAGVPFKTLYNGIDLDRYPYQEKKGDRLLFIGRMEPFKGAHWALWTAQTLRMPLDFIGKDHDTNQEYVKSLKNDIAKAQAQGHDIQYLGEVPHEVKLKYLQNAKALLFPALWSEPFGLVPIEASAVGTPVVATINGALPEVVAHGRSGLLAASLDEFADAVLHVDSIQPKNCREWVESKFTAPQMASRYVDCWQSILSGHGW